MPQTPEKLQKWHHPAEVMKLHQLKLKKKALQARITGDPARGPSPTGSNTNNSFDDILASKKRKNPFIVNKDSKRSKPDSPTITSESTDQTLFKLLHGSTPSTPPSSNTSLTSFKDILNKTNEPNVVVLKAAGERHIPLDWTLNKKVRLWSKQPFLWNQKLKVSEEASGTTGFARCLDSTTTTNLDTSPNAKFHQCCLFWQQPSLPWLSLFPRVSGKISTSGVSFATNAHIKASLQGAWTDSFRSLFQLIRTKQCPYFYVCANNFTALFRAAGICGFSDIHALITPTTRGFRNLLRQEDIEYTMPLKRKRNSDQGYETQDTTMNSEPLEDLNGDVLAEEEQDDADEEWLKSMGINAEEIKRLNYTQAKITHKAECQVDNSEQSLVLVEGVEINALYNFLLNCKSTISLTGSLAGIPPTLLSPVAFYGATLNSLKVRENKVHVDNADYYSIELTGPILPSTVHNLFAINSPECNMSATFTSLNSTLPFTKISREHSQSYGENTGNVIFDKENLSDCGLSCSVLEQFCAADKCRTIECLKYNSDTKTYSWT